MITVIVDKVTLPRCPECGFSKYTICYSSCKDCGDHDAYKCEKCDSEYDHVFHKEIFNSIESVLKQHYG